MKCYYMCNAFVFVTFLFANYYASNAQVIPLQYDSISAQEENKDTDQTSDVNYAYNVRLNLSGKKLKWLAKANMTDPSTCFYIQCKTGGIIWRDLHWCNIGGLDYDQRKLSLKSCYRSEYEYGVTTCPCNKSSSETCPAASPATLHTPWWDVLFYVMISVVTSYLVLGAAVIICCDKKKLIPHPVELTHYATVTEHAQTNDVYIDTERELPPPSYDRVTTITPTPSAPDLSQHVEDLPPDYDQVTRSSANRG